jgi:hypothetical protein
LRPGSGSGSRSGSGSGSRSGSGSGTRATVGCGDAALAGDDALRVAAFNRVAEMVACSTRRPRRAPTDVLEGGGDTEDAEDPMLDTEEAEDARGRPGASPGALIGVGPGDLR